MTNSTAALKNLKNHQSPTGCKFLIVESIGPRSASYDILTDLTHRDRPLLRINPPKRSSSYRALIPSTRPLIECHHPAFSCPLCWTYADLEEVVGVEPRATDLDANLDADAETDEGPSNATDNDTSMHPYDITVLIVPDPFTPPTLPNTKMPR